MAMPTFAVGAGSGGVGDVVPVLVEHQLNDVLLLFCESNFDQPVAPPAGWAHVVGSPVTFASGTRLSVFAMIADSSAVPAPTIQDPGDHVYVVSARVRGATGEGPVMLVDQITTQVAGASTALTWSSITTTHPDVLIVYASARGGDQAGGVVSGLANAGAVANLTEVFDAGTIDAGGGGIFLATGELAAEGATGDTTATINSAQVTARMTLAFYGGAPGGGPGPDPDPEPSGDEGALLTFAVPRVSKGDVLLALIVRDAPIYAQDGWTKVIDGLGASGMLLDGFARMVDDTSLAEVAFASIDPQELIGHLFVMSGASLPTLVEATAHAAFNADATPDAPAAPCQQAANTVINLWAAAGLVDLEAPGGFTAIDEYQSAALAQRTLLAASKTARATGALPAVAAAASPGATGRAFTVVLRATPPRRPRDLFDPVPGQIGLFSR